MEAGHIQATSGTNDAFDGDRIEAVDLDLDDGSALVDGHEPGGAGGEGIVDVFDGDGLGADGDGARDGIAVEDDVADAEFQS